MFEFNGFNAVSCHIFYEDDILLQVAFYLPLYISNFDIGIQRARLLVKAGILWLMQLTDVPSGKENREQNWECTRCITIYLSNIGIVFPILEQTGKW